MLFVPADRLPVSAHDRHAALREYFCDKDATAELAGDAWGLTLGWPGDLDRHVDPNLLLGLDWWDSQLSPEGMALSHRRSGKILRALYDTWTLQSWSEWLARGEPDDVVVLHVDDHRDLAPPRLILDDNGLWDAITSNRFEITRPDQVRSAIESGAVGMGSFLTPFLHAFPQTEVRHLGQAPKITGTTDYAMMMTFEEDRLLHPGSLRPSVELNVKEQGTGHGVYRATSSLDDWLCDLAGRPCLLHIDMDYFNNRYDGDSAWQARIDRLDPSLDDIILRIAELTGALNRALSPGQLEDVVIAYSPGFFPAEFWGASDRLLRQGLEALNG